MLNINQISTFITIFTFFIILLLCLIDYIKKRKITEYPFISFLIPCYNDGNTVKSTIESIYNVYDHKKFEIIIVDDKSKDNSYSVLQNLQKKYKFKLIKNKKNLGKTLSLNNIYKHAKSDILFFVDADIILNKKAVDDLIARLQSNDKVMAVSCPYNTNNEGFIPTMQNLDYNMFLIVQASYNLASCISLWGGCLMVRKKAFEEVGLFSVNMLCEDLDLAFKLNKAGWKVEQSFTHVKSYVPRSIRTWIKQKMRWSSGGMQAILKHFKIFIKHPVQIFYLVTFSLLTLFSTIFLIKEVIFFGGIWREYELLRQTATTLLSLKSVWLFYWASFLKSLLGRVWFTSLSLPYVIPLIKRFKDLYKVLYIIPFSLLYFSFLTVINIFGLIKGIYFYYTIKEGTRAW